MFFFAGELLAKSSTWFAFAIFVKNIFFILNFSERQEQLAKFNVSTVANTLLMAVSRHRGPRSQPTRLQFASNCLRPLGRDAS